MSQVFRTLSLLSLLLGTMAVAGAEVKVETVLEGLNNPCGVAIQPETGHVFVADSGALRVIRVVDGKAEDVIVGFSKDVYGKGPMYDIGPLGLVFLDKKTLVVGDGGNIDDKERLVVYEVPDAGQHAIKADQAVASFGLEANEELKAEGNYYAVAANKTGIFVTCNGDDNKGWVAKADLEGNKVTGFKRFIATKEAISIDAPVAVTISPRGDIVIGQMGEINVPEDSHLTFYDAKEGKLQRDFEIAPIHDITGLAYSPKTNQLYATDFVWPWKADAPRGGLFKLIAARRGNEQSIKVEKVFGLDRPTALAFAADGTLYITIAPEENKTTGKLLKIAPGL
jgi:DNA-binding beta-propeller fold protein YncE